MVNFILLSLVVVAFIAGHVLKRARKTLFGKTREGRRILSETETSVVTEAMQPEDKQLWQRLVVVEIISDIVVLGMFAVWILNVTVFKL